MAPPDCCNDHCPKCCVYCANAAAIPSTHPTGRCDNEHCPHCRGSLSATFVTGADVARESPPPPNRAKRRQLEAIARKGGDPTQPRQRHRGHADAGGQPGLSRGFRLAPPSGSRGDR